MSKRLLGALKQGEEVLWSARPAVTGVPLFFLVLSVLGFGLGLLLAEERGSLRGLSPILIGGGPVGALFSLLALWLFGSVEFALTDRRAIAISILQSSSIEYRPSLKFGSGSMLGAGHHLTFDSEAGFNFYGLSSAEVDRAETILKQRIASSGVPSQFPEP